MKKLILKFKHWLIKKLGGYTEQRIVSPRLDLHSHTFKPIKLRTDMAVDTSTMLAGMTDQEALEVFKRRMVYQLAEAMLKDDFVTISCTDDVLRCERIYRAELNVIHPRDAAVCML